MDELSEIKILAKKVYDERMKKGWYTHEDGRPITEQDDWDEAVYRYVRRKGQNNE